MSGPGDSTYSGSLSETADTVDGVTEAGSVGTRLAEAPPAEILSRDEYANDMRQGPAADQSDDASGAESGVEDGAGYWGESGDGDYSWTDPADQAQGMSRDEYANDMRQGPAVDLGDDASGGDDSDEYGAGYSGESGDGDYSWTDPAVQAQGMSRDECADYMQQGLAAGEDESASVGTADSSDPSGEPEASGSGSSTDAGQVQDLSQAGDDLDTAEQSAEDGANSQDGRGVAAEPSGDGRPPAEHGTREEATSEVQSRTAPPTQDAGQTDARTEAGATSAAKHDDAQGVDSSADEPTAEERAHLHEMYQDYLKEYGSGWGQGSNVLGDKPDRSPGDHTDQPPTGEDLLEPDDDNATRVEKFRHLFETDFDDVDDAFKNTATSVQQVLEQPSPTGHPGVVVDTHSQWVPESTPNATPDVGNLAELGLVLGVLGDRTVHYIRHKVAEMREGAKADASH